MYEITQEQLSKAIENAVETSAKLADPQQRYLYLKGTMQILADSLKGYKQC